MKVKFLAVAIIACVCALPQRACAGIYNPQEALLWRPNPYFWPLPTSFTWFRSTLGDLRGLPVKREMSESSDWVHDRYWNRMVQLEADERLGTLNASERIELAACYLRTRKIEEARHILTEAKKSDPRNFMILANLSAVSELSNDWDRATIDLKEALEAWPDTEPGFDPAQLRFYRRVENYHLVLLQQRSAESRNPPPPDRITIDHLFPEWERARGEAEYVPGPKSPKEGAELPADAVQIVQQLILWSPHDDRLFWLLGELLNSRGDVKSAAAVIDDLTYGRGFKPELVMRHRRILLEAARELDSLNGEKNRGIREQLYWATMPRGLPVPAGVGAFAQEGACFLAIAEANKDPSASAKSPGDSEQASAQDAPSSSGKSAPASWFPDLRAVAVGFAAGVVVTLLAGLQLREIRRRRELRAGHPPSGVG
jgi:tetratricopeptide (TPR) repeat protein